jgi:hypothetical protein
MFLFDGIRQFKGTSREMVIKNGKLTPFWKVCSIDTKRKQPPLPYAWQTGVVFSIDGSG